MTTVITAVDTEVRIEHGVLIALTLNGTPYYISNCYKTINYNGNDYTALAGFLSVSEIQSNISSTNDDIQVGLSAIPSAYITAILGQPIKGGQIEIYRAFFDYSTQEVLAGEIYKRFSGVITNFAVQEDFDNQGNPSATHTITVTASSILGVLENKVTGRRTNADDLNVVYSEIGNSGSDLSFNRVAELHNAQFDFGRPYTAPASQTGTGGGQGGGGSGGGGNVQTEQP